ncbi:MAG: ATP phosphoribosyltransferase regulatory subunit, partial [Acidimicrobiales bacterium]
LSKVGVGPLTARVNDRRLLSAIAAAVGVERAETAAFLVSLDKLDKIGWEGIRAELVERGFDERAGREAEQIISELGSGDGAKSFLASAARLLDEIGADVLEGLSKTADALEHLCGNGPLAAASYRLDPTLVRGQGYYTGQIFELSHGGATGSIAGGGRYDDLIGRSLASEVPACGISIGFERIAELAEVPPGDLGLALLYGSDADSWAVLGAARRCREGGRKVALVQRRSNEAHQLKVLAADGFSAVVSLVGVELGPERALEV